jgi:hypothetical protein
MTPAVGGTGETRLGPLTALMGVGYFFVWTVFSVPPSANLLRQRKLPNRKDAR